MTIYICDVHIFKSISNIFHRHLSGLIFKVHMGQTAANMEIKQKYFGQLFTRLVLDQCENNKFNSNLFFSFKSQQSQRWTFEPGCQPPLLIGWYIILLSFVIAETHRVQCSFIFIIYLFRGRHFSVAAWIKACFRSVGWWCCDSNCYLQSLWTVCTDTGSLCVSEKSYVMVWHKAKSTEQNPEVTEENFILLVLLKHHFYVVVSFKLCNVRSCQIVINQYIFTNI